MAMEEGFCAVEWRIENLSHWRAEVHGECIESPDFYFYCSNIELYPKGVNGQEEHLVVCLCDVKISFLGDLSFGCSNGVLLCKQPVNAKKDTSVLELPPGPKFEDVLSRIRESEDFITLRLSMKHHSCYEQRMCSAINVSKISLKIHPRWIEKLQPNEAKRVFFIQLYTNDHFKKRLNLETCLKNNAVNLMITPEFKNQTPFAVDICVNLSRSDGTVHSRIKKEHVFRDDSPWTFLDSLDKIEFVETGIPLFLCFKITTRNFIQSLISMNFDSSCVNFVAHNEICLTEKETPDTVTSNNKADSPVTVLIDDLMCLYQDQKFSDLELKCDSVSFPVHKNILSTRSPVFDRLLSSDMKEASSGTVDIGDLDPSTLGLFLTYLYTGAVEDLSCDRALNLYYAADKYQVPSLKKECSKFLCSNVSLSNVCDVLSLADSHQDEELTSRSYNFILDNFDAVLKSEEWDTLKKNEPILVAETLTQFAVKDRVARKHHLQ